MIMERVHSRIRLCSVLQEDGGGKVHAFYSRVGDRPFRGRLRVRFRQLQMISPEEVDALEKDIMEDSSWREVITMHMQIVTQNFSREVVTKMSLRRQIIHGGHYGSQHGAGHCGSIERGINAKGLGRRRRNHHLRHVFATGSPHR